jgi:hypothetical protein
MENQRLPVEDFKTIPGSSASDGMIPKMAGMTAVALALGVGIIYIFFISDRPVAQHVPADKYIWPAGCKPAGSSYDTGAPGYVLQYRIMDEIPRSCADPEYHIDDPNKYGLKGYGPGARHYYRIGPDAVDIHCHGDGTCVVNWIEHTYFLRLETLKNQSLKIR